MSTDGAGASRCQACGGLINLTSWFVFIPKGNRTLGPLTLGTLRAMAIAGELQKSTMVVEEGKKRWIRAGSITELFSPRNVAVDNGASAASIAAPPERHEFELAPVVEDRLELERDPVAENRHELELDSIAENRHELELDPVGDGQEVLELDPVGDGREVLELDPVVDHAKVADPEFIDSEVAGDTSIVDCGSGVAKEFLQRLSDSGLLDLKEIKALAESSKPKDSREFALELVRNGKLTKYQAEAVFKGNIKDLVLGNYVILEKIGQGGMGQVFKAQHRRMKRVVALKVLSPAVTKNEHAIQRFQVEVEAAAKLSHPNIVTAYDADEANGVHFLVMEYEQAGDLTSLIKKDGPMSVRMAISCIIQAAKGLEYAHRKGVVHRDIKPANLLLDGEGTIKILDMGLARIDGAAGATPDAAAAGLTNTGQVIGTADYMAPEQAMNSKRADHRSDIYSLGCTLHYLIVGKPMYEGETAVEKLLAHHQAPIPSLIKLQERVPPRLDFVYQKMVAKKADDRYDSMTKVIAALEMCLADLEDTEDDEEETEVPEEPVPTKKKASKRSDPEIQEQNPPSSERKKPGTQGRKAKKRESQKEREEKKRLIIFVSVVAGVIIAILLIILLSL